MGHNQGSENTGRITKILLEMQDGHPTAASRLWSIVYDEMKRLAARVGYRASSPLRMDTTDVVHETYLKLADQRRVSWQGRAHFYSVAAGVIRRLLIDWARSVNRKKRGGGMIQVPFDGMQWEMDRCPLDLLVLDDALCDLQSANPRWAKVVELKFFASMTTAEIAEVLRVATRTVEGDWLFARAWLQRRMGEATAK